MEIAPQRALDTGILATIPRSYGDCPGGRSAGASRGISRACRRDVLAEAPGPSPPAIRMFENAQNADSLERSGGVHNVALLGVSTRRGPVHWSDVAYVSSRHPLRRRAFCPRTRTGTGAWTCPRRKIPTATWSRVVRAPIMTRVRKSGRRLLTRAERPVRWPDRLAGHCRMSRSRCGLVQAHGRDRGTATSGDSWDGAVAVLGQPADVSQASQRPPCADEVAVDVEERVAPGRLGPVDGTGDLVIVDEDVAGLQVAVDEHWCPRPERSLGVLGVAGDQAGGKDVAGDEPLAVAVQARCELAGAAGRAMVAAARRAASAGRHLPRPAPPATRQMARRGGPVPCLAGRRARAPAACATGSAGPGPAPSPRPRRWCASDQCRSPGTCRRRAAPRARYERRRPRPPARWSSSPG